MQELFPPAHLSRSPDLRKTAPAVKPRKDDVDKIPEGVDEGKPAGLVRGDPPFPMGEPQYTGPLPTRPIPKRPGLMPIVGK
jgi:hypothetical protein